MKLLEVHLIEKYEDKFTVEQLVNEGIPKLFLKMEAIKRDVVRLEKKRKQLVTPYMNETNSTDKKKIIKVLKELTKEINDRKKNLTQLAEMETNYISQIEDSSSEVGTVFEDTDIGHQDDEPGMLRADLSIIERYADELGEMMEEYENSGVEIDFPHWLQAKIIKAKDYLIGAKHYLKSELEKKH